MKTDANNCELKLIELHATRFRDAIESTDRHNSLMAEFPKESCDHACVLLGWHFEQQGVGAFETIAGKHLTDEQGAHHWLKKGNIIVDITADQFEGVDDRVIVTRHSPWHDSLDGTALPPPENPDYEADARKCYGELYQRVVTNIQPEYPRPHREME